MADDITSQVKKLIDQGVTLEKMSDIFRGLSTGVKDTSDGMRDLSNSFESFSKLGIQNTKTLEGTVNSFGQLRSAFNDFKDGMTNIAGLGKIIGVGDAFKAAIEPISLVVDTIGYLSSLAKNTAQAFDGMDAGAREMNKTQFALAANLGLGFEQAEKFSQTYRDIVKSNSELSATGFYIDAEEFKTITSALQRQGLAMTDLAEQTGLAGEKMNYLQTMTMQAKAMGMDVESYAKKMGDMVRRSGLSMEDSMKLLASTQDIARGTGLKVDEVTQSLDGATSGFQRMGTTINFGMPVLKGFASSITEVGLGIAQAGDLAADFSKNLLNIVNNPALAYITSMKGGFSGAMGGGGGILNPSIQMQAMMLDQSPDSQAELAKNLSIGMRETLKSFSGSDIISVKQAAESPELQTKFYVQQQMLGSQFGISDTATQNRVLEYLQKLEEATYAGDDESASMLERQISEAADANNKTLSMEEKISLSMNKSIIIAEEQMALQKGMLTAMMMDVENKSGKEGENELINRLSSAFDELGTLLNGGKNISDMSSEELEKYKEERTNFIKSASARFTQPQPEQNQSGSVEGMGAAKVSTSQNVNVNLVITNGTGKPLDINTEGVGGIARVAATTP
jgi:hypothetical protein